MKLKLFLFLFGISILTQAQDSLFHKNLVIVSFNPDMFNNQAARPMLQQSGMSYDEMVNFLNKEMTYYIGVAFQKIIKSFSLNTSLTTNTTEDLYTIWTLQGYFLSPIPKEQKRNVDPTSKLIGRKNPKNNGGEVIPEINSLKGNFLDSKIADKKTFMGITRKLHANFVLIINELDIKEDYSNPYAVGKNDYTRQLQIHFTLFNNKGEEVAGNVATVDFSSKENDIKKVVESYFPVAANKIKLFVLPYLQ
ncbi:MAG: hypothetical protein J7L46_05600 [Bacteroidales bacterium]|nr:hypothetical protein [Bacteroidales bacterium]